MIRNLLLILLTIGTLSTLSAQNYSDDFETYSVGDYIGSSSNTWSTWSGTTGGAEDAKIVSDKAKSGNNSIYFYSTGNGPQDVLLNFGAKYTTGVFTLKFSLFVTEGASAYWNFQQEVTPGVTWAGNAYYRDDNTLSIDAGSEVMNTPYNAGQWNDVEYVIDLDNNEWIVKINDVCVGTLLAPASVASLDLYPSLQGASVSEFWIDDVSYNYDETVVVKDVDVVLSNVAIDGAAIAGTVKDVAVTITNTGKQVVNDIELAVSIDGGSGTVQSFDGLNLASGESTVVSIPEILNVKKGTNVINISLSSIDGFGSDDVPCNSSVVTGVRGFELTPNKRVVVEEATGTWCPWCVRGTVFMAAMEEKYTDKFVGIAVHNGDPMTVTEYDTWIGNFPGFSGYPNAVVDRVTVIDPSGIESPMITRLQEPINETFTIGSYFDEDLGEMIVQVQVNAINNLASNRRLVVVLTEDDVTGTGSGYNQANAYAGGGNGPMGGYENLPSPVPASQMVYEEVARAILTPANGMKIDVAIPAGESKVFTFGTSIDPTWELEHIKIAAFIVAPDPVRTVDNAFDISFEDSQNFFVSNKDIEIDIAVQSAPNPTSDITNISLELTESSEVKITLFNVAGQIVSSKDYGKLSGKQIFPINATNLDNGIYNAIIEINGKRVVERISVSH